MKFKRVQHEFDKENATQRQHYVPLEVYRFAVMERMKYRNDTPTLADIYYALVKRGIELVNSGKAKPVFSDKNRVAYSVAVRIWFDYDTNDQILALKFRAENGEFETPDGKTHLVSYAVVLMETAIQNLNQPSESAAQ